MFCALAMVSTLTACASSDEAVPEKYNEPRFDSDGIVNLKVNKVEIVSFYVLVIYLQENNNKMCLLLMAVFLIQRLL